MLHPEVHELQVAGLLPRPALSVLLYQHLSFRCDTKSGYVHDLSVTDVARELRCSRGGIQNAAAVLRKLGLLVGKDAGGNCLSGVLPHIPACLSGEQLGAAVTPAEGRAIAHSPSLDGRNGSEHAGDDIGDIVGDIVAESVAHRERRLLKERSGI